MADCKIIMAKPQPTAVIRVTAALSDVPQLQKSAREKIAEAMPTLNAGTEGYGFTLWRPPVGGRISMEPGVIVTQSFKDKGEIVSSELPGGRVGHFVMFGPHAGLPDAWKMLLGWIEQRNMRAAGTNWEIYGDDHPEPAKLKTSLYALLK